MYKEQILLLHVEIMTLLWSCKYMEPCAWGLIKHTKLHHEYFCYS